MNRCCSAALSATAPAGRSDRTRAFASRNRTPPSQARSRVCLKTRHRRVSSTANHLIGSSPTGTSPNRPYPRRRLLVGAVGLEPTSPRAEDFKSPASANSATLPSRPTAAVYSTKSRHRLFPRWTQRGLFHGGSIFSPHQLGRRTGEARPPSLLPESPQPLEETPVPSEKTPTTARRGRGRKARPAGCRSRLPCSRRPRQGGALATG